MKYGIGISSYECCFGIEWRMYWDELSKKNELTGLHPFMSGAQSHRCQLVDVYMAVLKNVNILKKNETSSAQKRNRMHKKCYDPCTTYMHLLNFYLKKLLIFVSYS